MSLHKLSEEKEEAMRRFIFYDGFEEGKRADEVANLLLVAYSEEDIRAYLYGFNNPTDEKSCSSFREYVERCLDKREDLYWDCHPLNQDWGEE